MKAKILFVSLFLYSSFAFSIENLENYRAVLSHFNQQGSLVEASTVFLNAVGRYRVAETTVVQVVYDAEVTGQWLCEDGYGKAGTLCFSFKSPSGCMVTDEHSYTVHSYREDGTVEAAFCSRPPDSEEPEDEEEQEDEDGQEGDQEGDGNQQGEDGAHLDLSEIEEKLEEIVLNTDDNLSVSDLSDIESSLSTINDVLDVATNEVVAESVDLSTQLLSKQAAYQSLISSINFDFGSLSLGTLATSDICQTNFIDFHSVNIDFSLCRFSGYFSNVGLLLIIFSGITSVFIVMEKEVKT